MRISSSMTAAAFIASLAVSTGAIAADFEGVPEFPRQQAQNLTDPPVTQQLQRAQTGPYDSRDFVVPPYEVYP